MSDQDLLAKLEAVSQFIPPTEMAEVLNNLAAAAREIARSNLEIEFVRSKRQVVLANIQEKHQTIRLAMLHIFAERRTVIQEHFRMIDLGLERQNDKLLDRGLTGLANIVTSSPFVHLDQLGAILDSGGTIEI